jgi:outer membrane protein TolC
MKILHPALVLAGLLAATGPSLAQAPLSPRDCIEAALQHSPLLSENRHLLAADRADITKKRGTTLPYLSSTLQAYELWGNPTEPWVVVGGTLPGLGVVGTRRATFIPKASWDPIGVEEIGISYPIFYQGSILGLNDPPVVASAVATMTQQQLTTLISEQAVILNVLTEYIYAISYREQVAVQQQIVDADQKQLEITQDQVNLGIMVPYQLETARAQLQAAQQALDASRANVQAALFQLGSLMGIRGETPQVAEVKLPLIQLPPLGPLLDKVMRVDPALRVQDATVEIARQQLLVDRAVRLPDVTLNNEVWTSQDWEYINGGTTHPSPVNFQSYLTVNIPLYDFGQRHAGVVASDERYQAARDDKVVLETNLRQSIKQTYNDILFDNATLAGNEGAYAKAKEALGLAQAQQEVSQIDELALITAQLAVFDAQALVVSNQMLELLKYAQLQNLSGGTWGWVQ